MNKSRARRVPSHHLMVETADWSAIIQARKQGVEWDQLRTRNGLSALGMAIFENSPLAVRTLLEMGCPLESEALRDGTVFSPLWSALEKRQPAIVDLLLQAGADPNEPNAAYGMPIYYAAEHAMEQETIILCRHGCIPNTDVAPSPLWLWIRNLSPRLDKENNQWVFPDSEPILALLKSGARITVDNGEEDVPVGLSELEFAKQQWLNFPLPKTEWQKANLTLSLMERNLFSTMLPESNGRDSKRKM